ncbi:LacI family DNA-binding transcriptional regulator [Chelativorans sp. AA-79]|uniref:LacI family DNA-binding transcriptional regulator n=1 Tax=Chelativorans sp. AA-79 TaxID=3028735 RepID=UPI0023F69660|nr:LacI family DNA-binding transcriptional regulator [Chelativorans sp. AA-79]WEX11109.1 LacI family DNA-binding transcriptional regulator [Chelativorans sp. AA-79]
MARLRARLKDIAEATGFSANTVSLALRGSPRLPEETRERILEAAARLNYFPNHIARSLVHSATRTIGLVMTDIMNPTLTLAARTIERELSLAGYAMMFAASDSSVENEKRAIELFLSYQVDGMLIYPASHREYDHIKAADEAGTPVLLLVNLPGSALDTVTIDDRAGAYKAFRHLCQKGHRRIAMLDGGRALGNFDKMHGALRAVREAGLAKEAITVFEPEGHAPTHGFTAMERIMQSAPRPTALFASTDSLAVGALHWCRENGIAVPQDLAVIGYDNTEISQYGALPLTTVNYAADEISRIGVDRILKRIESRGSWNARDIRLIEPELILRDSA